MNHCDLIINAEWIITVDPDERILTDSSLIVNDGRILAIEPRKKALENYQPSATIDRPGHALIPGLINSHTHAAMSLYRGFADDLPLERWLHEAIWPAEKRWVSAEMVRDGSRLAIAEMLKSGTTCFADQYFYPEIVAETAAEHHMRAVIATPVVDFDTGWAKGASEHLQKGADRVHDPFAEHPLITTAFAPHSMYALADSSLGELKLFADQLDRQVQMHLHETAQEIADSLEKHGCRPLERLDRAGLVNASLVAVHAVHVSDSDQALLEKRGVSVAHCPRSNLKLGSGIAPVAEMLERGINVGIGTDGAASNNALDMLSEMRYAALLAKGSTQQADALTANKALRLATIDAARLLGLEQHIGSIEIGKWADLACVDLNRLQTQPLYDPVAQIVYAARADQVTDVWSAGRQHLESGKLVDIDEQEVLARCMEWRHRIAQGRPE